MAVNINPFEPFLDHLPGGNYIIDVAAFNGIFHRSLFSSFMQISNTFGRAFGGPAMRNPHGQGS
jgi:hypothetical protein